LLAQALLTTLLPVLLRASVPCDTIRNLSLPSTQITFAQAAGGGTFLGPLGIPVANVPPFCRVAGAIAASKDSQIEFEVWMPEQGWNGKFRAAGNGGFAGSINYGEMAAAVRDGYASASTDTGHSGGGTDAGWALGRPEKIVDFGYRAIHEMTTKAKAIVQAFYGEAPQRSYFSSCSNGGRQALMEAQRFPDDYDGILAGAPANFWTHLLSAGYFNIAVPMMKDPARYLPAAKVPAISAAVLAACDAGDGLKDGLLNDPMKCHFDPATLLCNGKETDTCLTKPQADTVGRIYGGTKNAQGEQIFPGLSPGGEDGPGGWPNWVTGTRPGNSAGAQFGTGFFRNMVFEDASWQPENSNNEPGDAMNAADAKMAQIMNSTDANLKAFEAHGGKLILYHGWSDAAIPPLNAVNYYQDLRTAMGASSADTFVRLYMVPGMQHCAGGPGPSQFGQFAVLKPGDARHDIYTALEQWVEKGTPPQEIIAAKGREMTRPICPYPQIAKYQGTGDPKDAKNFVCAVNP
jgi:feruloyl esterase